MLRTELVVPEAQNPVCYFGSEQHAHDGRGEQESTHDCPGYWRDLPVFWDAGDVAANQSDGALGPSERQQ